MKTYLKRLDDAFHFELSNEEGRIVQTDGSVAIGGKGNGMRPKELLLMAAASCSTIDVVMVLKKMRQQLDDISVETDGEWEKSDEHTVLKKLHLRYKLLGNIKPQKAVEAVKMSLEKYCSVTKTLEKSAEITFSVELNGEAVA